MLRSLFKYSCIILFGVMMAGATGAQDKEWSREDAWKQVDKAREKGRPKTAIKHIEPIIEAAAAEKDYDELIKAIVFKIALQGEIQGHHAEEKIARLEKAIQDAPAPAKPILNSILANWHLHYFQQNRWRIMRRTRTSEAPGDDMTTWSLPRILKEIDLQFTRALADSDKLKKIPVEDYDELLEQGNVPDSYRPTLFDFVAYDALDFYTAGEQAGAAQQDAFEIPSTSPVFAPAEDFIEWKPATADQDSPTLKAVKLYQELLKFHMNDQDKSAFIEANLTRLIFGHNKAFGNEKDEFYKKALSRIEDRWQGHPIAARALHRWAEVLRDEGDLVKAHEIASRGFKRFPESFGGKKCFNLVHRIEAPSLDIRTERVWNKPWPDIKATYRNLNKIYFRAYSYNFAQRLKEREKNWNFNVEYLDQDELKKLLRTKPNAQWSANVAPTPDYAANKEHLDAPKDLGPGPYFIVASADESFSEEKNMVSFASVWVSELALVIRRNHAQGALGGFVLDALSGEPIKNANVRAWTIRNRQKQNSRERVELDPVKTDTKGRFSIPMSDRKRHLIFVQHGKEQLAAGSGNYAWRRQKLRRVKRTVLFTDRSLYRPGQTVHYKGICLETDRDKNNYKTLRNRHIQVQFADVNGKKIEANSHSCNDYGSFSGSFTAPHDRLTGQMRIHVQSGPSGSISFNVEEYKRPKFRVELSAPDQPARLEKQVKLTGKATAYTGVAIGNAEVRYRVVRRVQYPPWWRYYGGWPQTESQEIAHGRTTTANDGSFEVEFTAKPDRSVSPEKEPVFHYAVDADVTDTTGETRSSDLTVKVGYKALQASLAADDWQTTGKPVEIDISTRTLDSEGEAAEGTLKIYRLRQPEKVVRPPLSQPYRHRHYRQNSDMKPAPDLSSQTSWDLGELVAEKKFRTDSEGNAALKIALGSGAFRAILETADGYGKKVTARLPLKVFDIKSNTFEIHVPNEVAAPKWTLEPGEEFKALWGTGYESGRAFVEVEHRGKIVQSYWTEPGNTQVLIRQKVSEQMRGGFVLRVTYVRENRAYLTSRTVNVPWSNKELSVKWEHFESRLKPGQKSTWSAIISGPDSENAVAEMVATLYDASLDAFKPHHWPASFGRYFRKDSASISMDFQNRAAILRHRLGRWQTQHKSASMRYRSYPHLIRSGRTFQNLAFGARGSARMVKSARAEESLEAAAPAAETKSDAAGAPEESGGGAAGEPPEPEPDLSKVKARKNLDETAFFFPHLSSDGKGKIKMTFTMPEALTEWKFMGFAHDNELRSGFMTSEAVTAKDLMVEPNPPRFVREGDVLEFTVKVSNQSPARQTGSVRLTFADARTLKRVDQDLGLEDTDRKFNIRSGRSETFAWRIRIPDGMGFLTYKTVGSTGRLSDGEEGYLPVLSRKIMVTESLPLPIRGPKTKKFEFKKLLESGKSETLSNQTLTVQMVSQPAWYAVLALPYLMEYPHECTEQAFNRLYANSLARYIAGSNPKIRRIFDHWKATETLDSPMFKNQDLKDVMIDETPWLRDAMDDSEARRNIGILFDENRLNDETSRLIQKLKELQYDDGAWPWFPGGRPNDYITLYITTGFGRLRHLGVELDMSPAVKSINRLDNWIDRRYRQILKRGNKDDNHLTSTIALYLYCRSFFLDDKAVNAKHKEAVDFFLDQARKHWLTLPRQSQAHAALGLKRFGDNETPKDIMISIKEHAVTDEELGMFWRDTERSWWWYRAPIETQAMMIEAFDEIMGDEEAVEECRVWLLKQKQTQDWKTTKATADAVYGLLLRGTDILTSDQLVKVDLGGKKIEPGQVEAGTGYYEERFVRSEIKPSMGKITVTKTDKGVSWGSVHWQYLEDIGKVTAHTNTPLKLKKDLYVREYTKEGPVLNPAKRRLSVGDELVTRVIVKVDRAMEYVHLKDHRGSGTEPVSVLSRYRFQDGLAYYESTKDTASHFFIDYLPKGTYVFEYSVRIQLRGEYHSGMASIQCMYAPEYNSHSQSRKIVVD